jgi:hypothetical protein
MTCRACAALACLSCLLSGVPEGMLGQSNYGEKLMSLQGGEADEGPWFSRRLLLLDSVTSQSPPRALPVADSA